MATPVLPDAVQAHEADASSWTEYPCRVSGWDIMRLAPSVGSARMRLRGESGNAASRADPGGGALILDGILVDIGSLLSLLQGMLWLKGFGSKL